MKILAALILALFASCSSSTSSPPTLPLVGNYTLTRANGSALPAPYTVPIYGSVIASSGGVTIANDYRVTVTVHTDARVGAPNATWTVEGHMHDEYPGYQFTFSDGTTATGTYSVGVFTILHVPNTLVFTKN